jgi:hypothetical protein
LSYIRERSTAGTGFDGLGNQIGFLPSFEDVSRAAKIGAKIGTKLVRQGVEAGTKVLREGAKLVTSPITSLFNLVLQRSINSAKPMPVPVRFKKLLAGYAVHNPNDGKWLLMGYKRRPIFYRGGWILKFQSQAGAMTLDTHVFVGEKFTPSVYVHEMVHVAQYKIFGISGFLSTYFSSSAITILDRWRRGVPLDPVTSSFLENDAHAIANRFATWCQQRDPSTAKFC